ncbi:MAG: O-antigen ligase family protein [Phototrophicaceae bacterium]
MIRTDSIVRISLTLIFLYMFAVGATYNGMLIPELKWFSLGLLALLAVAWLLLRWRGGWTWHATPLDLPLVLWAGAIVLSLLPNTDSWRRSAIGAWYVGLYMVLWFALTDAMANRLIKRGMLIDATLFGGLLIIAFGYVQVFAADFNLLALDFPRPGSLVGNPNALGAFLVVVTTLAVGRAAYVRVPLARWVLAAYSVLALALLLMTFSRGAWLGMAAGALALMALVFYLRGGSLAVVRAWWQGLSPRARQAIIGAALAGLALVIALGLVFVDSLDQSGRTVDLRTRIYQNAAAMFSEQPVTGHGLFTFGEQFLQYQSQPPRTPHSHAHNGLLHVAAELGAVGLVAFGVSLVFALLSITRNLSQASPQQRGMIVPATAALFGFGVHHLFDFPAMMSLIAFMGLLALLLAAQPLEPQPLQARWRRRGHPLGIAGLTLALLLTGVWSTAVYSGYHNALRAPFGPGGDGDYRAAAEAMQAAVDADPRMPVYHSQQGYLYGLAALEGDDAALPLAIAAYRRLIDLEPSYAVGWANLAALLWEDGDREDAIGAMDTAVALAPGSLPLRFNLAMYYAAVGRADDARDQYAAALFESTRLWPEWQATELRRAVVADYQPSDAEVQTLLWLGGEASQPEIDYAADDDARGQVIGALIALEDGSRDQAAAAVDRAAAQADDDEATAWVRLGQAALARADGDDAQAAALLEAARALIAPEFDEEDYIFGVNIPYYQFLRFSIPRSFLPPVFYPSADAALSYLLAALAVDG